MAQMKLDKMVKTLQVRSVTMQDRIAASGNLAGLRFPPAVLSHEWRLGSPGSSELDPPTCPVVGAIAPTAGAKRAGRPAASRFGSPAVTSRANAAPFQALRQDDRHDCLSHDCREALRNGETGYRPGRGPAPADSRGRG